LMDRVVRLRPHQCTLVPVRPGEVTSEAGWQPDVDGPLLRSTIDRLRSAGVRVSLFVEAEPAAIEWAGALGADRIELYTEPYARAHERGEGEASFHKFAAAAERAHALGLGINAGHDLDLDNLPRFAKLLHLDEVSIGHALISRAVFVGLDRVCREYLAVLGQLPK
jgi:pyridoxine 5-phosphate synthase